MLEFEKGYLCFWDVNIPNIWKCKGEGDHEGVVKYKWGSADYIKLSGNQLKEWNELGKWQSIDGHWYPVEDFLDHHYMLCAEENCAIADTPKEALRQFLLLLKTKQEEDRPQRDYYVRKDNRFYYLNDVVNDKEKWDELIGDSTVIYAWAMGWYSEQYEMHEIELEG